jgi:ribosomal protein RSM22 (predicted rRNA methylase)
LILLEPALRETSRALLAVRDHLLGKGFDVIAPCFFTGPCPALIRERDWCHDSAVRGAGRVDFSYLVVRASGDASTDPALCRIVSDPLPEKGRLKLFACGSDGRHPLVRLDRHASPSNAAIEELVRGDTARILRVAFAQDGLRVVKETIVTRDTTPATAAGPAPDRPSRTGS